MAAATETETTPTVEAAAVGRRRHWQWRHRKHWDNNDCDNRAGHHAVVGDGDWYNDNMATMATVTKTKIMTTTVGRGLAVAVLKIEPSVAGGNGGGRQQSTKSSENGGGGNISKRCQARGEKRRWWWWQRQG